MNSASFMRLVRLVGVVGLALAGVVPLVFGQGASRYHGQPIVGVEYRGLTTLSEETINHYLFGGALEAGATLDEVEINTSIRRLWDRELIDGISIEAEKVDDGVRLIVHIVERSILISVEYVGSKKVTRADIAEHADRERINVYEGQPLQQGELLRLKGAIQDLYKEKGYRFAQVDFTLEDVGLGQQRVTFTIDEGDKVKIADIAFDGNTVFGDWRLRQAMKKTKESGLISRIGKKDIYNPATIEEDLDLVRDLYRKSGYKDILIAKPEIAVRAKNPGAATVKEQKRRLAITIPVEEGDRWQLGEISIEGNEVFSDELLLQQFEQPRGGWLRSKVLDTAIENIGKLYSSIGYIFANVDSEIRERPNTSEKVADLVVHIEEADQFRVGRIEFEGNSKTRDKVLRREMLVQEGLVMNMTSLQNSILKIRQLNYFALNEDEPIQFDFRNEDQEVDLIVQGDEADRTELQFGGGWSELDGFFGQFALRTTNFLGRGETLGASFQSGSLREAYDLEYSVPWFLDRPQSIGVRLFNQELDNTVLTGVQFRQSISGASITYGRNLRAFQSLSFTYSYTDVDDVQTLIGFDGLPVTVEQSFKASSLRPFWIRNTMDSRFEPTRGSRMSLSLEYAGGFLGGESDYFRPTLAVTKFFPLSRRPFQSSFAVKGTAGYIEPLSDSPLFPQQRFFLGGDSSVRGFGRNSIVVRDENGFIVRDQQGFPLGGEKMLQFNLEYHMILGGPFRLVVFGDAGGVFSPEQDISTDLFRYSAGAELRIAVPLFPAPIRFIYAINLDPLPNEQFESFDFSLSTTF